MMGKPQPEQEDQEYDLKDSTKKIGQLYPVLKAADGEILDGCHRLDSDPSWKSTILENIDTPEKKFIVRLVANFHRRTVPHEEKVQWINQLAEIYRENGLKVEGIREKAQGSNEIVRKICEVTGINWRTVLSYLEPCFKQNSHRRLDSEQHRTYGSPEEIIFNSLKGRSTKWAKSVIDRLKEEHERELMESPIFRKKVLDKINGKPKALNPTLIDGESRDRQIEEFLNLPEDYGLPEKMPKGEWETKAEKRARLKKEANLGYEPLPEYYETFVQECPNCMCSKCDHAETCIERVRKGESPVIYV